MKKIVCFVSLFTILLGCSPQKSLPMRGGFDGVEYAKLFTISDSGAVRVVTVNNPWDSTAILSKYILVHRDSVLPLHLPDGILVRVPVQRIAVYSAVDAGMIDMLGCGHLIKAACEPQYVKLPYIMKGIENGSVIDIGMSSKPNIERLLVSECDIIFSTPFQNKSYGAMAEMGIVISESASYMESHPLGRSEWLKFIAAFLDCSPVADSLFNDIKSRYDSVKDRVAFVEKKRTLLPEKRFGQSWWVPGGDSYAAQIYKDAAADYIWSSDRSVGSLGLSFEEIFIKAAKSDVWVMRYFKEDGDLTLAQLESEYKSYALFDAFKSGSVYGCNTASSVYYTFASARPDIEIRDMAIILYPELFEGEQTTYYKQLK